MQLRAGVILILTLLGILLLVSATVSATERKLVSAFGCFVLAVVYAQITRPRRPPSPFEDR